MSNALEVGDRVRVRTHGGTPAARKYANEEGWVSLMYEGLDGASTCEVRIFGHNFETVFEEEDLATVEKGAKKPVGVGLLSGLQSQGELNELLEKLFVSFHKEVHR